MGEMTRRWFVLQIAAPLAPSYPNRRNIAWDDFLEVVNRNTVTIDWLHKYLTARENESTLATDLPPSVGPVSVLNVPRVPSSCEPLRPLLS